MWEGKEGHMAEVRSMWEGTLRINNVFQIPVNAYAANNSAEKLSFNQLHKECGTRINLKKWCATCNRELAQSEIESGYEHSNDHFIRVTAEEKARIKVESLNGIDIKRLCAAEEFDPMYVHNTYYLAPSDGRAASAYLTMARAFRGRVGIGKASMLQRQYVVAIRAVGDTLVMHTLHRDAELRKPSDIGLDLSAAKVTANDVQRVSLALKTLEGKLDFAEFKDEHREGLRKIIEGKINGDRAARSDRLQEAAA
jgi:DNA end-binding protein Ku